MIDPKKVLTKSVQEELQAHLWNLEQAAFFLVNNVDDLWFGDEVYDLSSLAESITKKIKEGPYEERED